MLFSWTMTGSPTLTGVSTTRVLGAQADAAVADILIPE